MFSLVLFITNFSMKARKIVAQSASLSERSRKYIRTQAQEQAAVHLPNNNGTKFDLIILIFKINLQDQKEHKQQKLALIMIPKVCPHF